MLDNLNTDCIYLVSCYYEMTCTGGWNAEGEGFNPNYCNMLITILDVTQESCGGGGDPMQDCIASGGNPEDCACQLYGGPNCGGSGGGEEEENCSKTIEYYMDKVTAVGENFPQDESAGTPTLTTLQNSEIKKSVERKWLAARTAGIPGVKIHSYETITAYKANSSSTYWYFKPEDCIRHDNLLKSGTIFPVIVTHELIRQPKIHLGLGEIAFIELDIRLNYSILCKGQETQYDYDDVQAKESWIANSVGNY